MAEKSTIARPYAAAAFALAQEAGDLKAWSQMLQFTAAVVTDAEMDALISNPAITQDKMTELFIKVCGDQINEMGQNFIRVLAENKRQSLLPEIAELYEVQRAEAERTVEAEIISAFPVSDSLIQQLATALKKRLGREVNLVARIDEALIGGAIIRAGDMVIDGSLTGQLEKLAHALTH